MIPSRLFVLLIYLLGFHAIVLPQSKMVDRSSDSRPSWTTKTPKGIQNDYYVGFGESSVSLAEAKRFDIGNAIQSIVEERSLSAESSLMTKRSYDINRVIDEVSIKGKSSTIEGLRQNEYYYETWNEENSSNRYIFWILASVPKDDPGKIPSTYTPLFKSLVVPGWGQYSKGHGRKGLFILSTELLTISGAIITNELSKNANEDAMGAQTQELRDWYNDRSDNYYKASFALWLAAIGTYLWNTVDALVSDPRDLFVSGNKYQLAYDKRMDRLLIRIEIAL